MIKIPCLLLVISLVVSGCATSMTASTYVMKDDVMTLAKRTVVKHSWWGGLPALAPMTAEIKDGEFSISSTSVELNGIINGSLKN